MEKNYYNFARKISFEKKRSDRPFFPIKNSIDLKFSIMNFADYQSIVSLYIFAFLCY